MGDTEVQSSPLQLPRQLEERQVELSRIGRDPSLGPSPSPSMEQTKLQEGITLKTHKLSEDAAIIPQSSSNSTEQSEFKLSFKMVIHTDAADGRLDMRIGTNDTGSDVDLISQDVVTSLGMTAETYDGPSYLPLGPAIHPIGKIQLNWHIAGREKTYTTTFAVLNKDQSRNFDVILGKHTIREIGFYRNDSNVWFVEKPGVIQLIPGFEDPHDHNLSASLL